MQLKAHTWLQTSLEIIQAMMHIIVNMLDCIQCIQNPLTSHYIFPNTDEHSHWFPDEGKNQDISSCGIDLIILKYSTFNTRLVYKKNLTKQNSMTFPVFFQEMLEMPNDILIRYFIELSSTQN